MVMRSVRKLTEEEMVVFDAISEQSLKYPDKPFAYDINAGQLYLNMRGAKINRENHLKIIQKLDKDGVIEADWLLKPNEDNLPLMFHELARKRSWSPAILYDLSVIVMGEIGYDDYYFINLRPEHAENVKKASEIVGVADIAFNKNDKTCLDVIVADRETNEKSIITIHTFKSDDDRVFHAVRYVMAKQKETGKNFATKHELETKVTGYDNKTLVLAGIPNVPKVFNGNDIINGPLSPFFIINKRGLGINQGIELSQYALDLIKQASVETGR